MLNLVVTCTTRFFFFWGGGFLWISTIYDLIIQREWSNIINIHFWVFIGAQVNNPFSLAHMVFSEMEECFVINCSPFSCCKLCIYCFYFLAFLDLSTFGCVRLCEKHLQKVIANHRWFWQSFFIKKNNGFDCRLFERKCDTDPATFNLEIVYRSMRSVCTCPFSYFDWLIIKLKERKKEIFMQRHHFLRACNLSIS